MHPARRAAEACPETGTRRGATPHLLDWLMRPALPSSACPTVNVSPLPLVRLYPCRIYREAAFCMCMTTGERKDSPTLSAYHAPEALFNLQMAGLPERPVLFQFLRKVDRNPISVIWRRLLIHRNQKE